jgi:branched-chain amino acid transport system permease protein
MSELLALTVIGLCTASIFALAACGLVLTYTTTGVFNFAHGAIAMLGAFAYWQLHDAWGWPSLLSVASVVLVLAPALGVVIERGIMRGLSDAADTTRLIVSISLLVALLGLGLWIWSPQEPHGTTLLFAGHRVRIFDVIVSMHQASALLLAAVTAVGLRLLLFRTRIGLDMRASVDSRPLAMLHGARPDRAAMLAWAIGCSLAALAGILIAPLSALSHTNLTLLIVNAYAAAVFGRLRSLPVTFLGAVILGLADSYSIGYIPSDNQYFSTFRLAVPSVLLFTVLLAVPHAAWRPRARSAMREEVPRPSWRGALLTSGATVLTATFLASMLSDVDTLRATKILGIGLIALSLIPLSGFGGQISLCQMSFAGIGAVVMGHHGHGGDPAALILAAILCAAVGTLIALPALRLSGIYLALATAAFAVFLDRWVWALPPFDLGPWKIRFFDGTLPVDPLDVPGVHEGPASQLIVVSVAFALLYLLVVAVRRSPFGDRLLAMKDSPAACVTIGIDVTRVKVAVFALSAAMAGVGGALYAGTSGSVSADTFSLFESLPLLLLAVVGGISTASGALFAGVILGGYPIAVGIWPFMANLNRVLPGTMGVTLGRNPNGAVRDISSRAAILLESPLALGGLLLSLAVAAVSGISGAATGWGVTYVVALSLVAWPQLATVIVARRGNDAGAELEWAGIVRPLSVEQLHAMDEALALEASR